MAELFRFIPSELGASGTAVLDDQRWSVESFVRAGGTRVRSRKTIDGFITRPVARDARTLQLRGVYYPHGRSGRATGRRQGDNWYEPSVSRVDALEGLTVSVRSGSMIYGDFVLATFNFDHRRLLVGLRGGVAPLEIRWTLKFIEVSEDIQVDTPPTQTVEAPILTPGGPGIE